MSVALLQNYISHEFIIYYYLLIIFIKVLLLVQTLLDN